MQVENDEVEGVHPSGRAAEHFLGVCCAPHATRHDVPDCQLVSEDLAVREGVIHDQSSQAHPNGISQAYSFSLSGLLETDRKPESRTFAEFAFNTNSTPHHF